MKFKIKYARRTRWTKYLILFLMAILILRLGNLTIVNGDYYRELSENMRIKEVYVSAPRGEIRDRNGILLAGNKPMFTLQIFKDEFSGMKTAEKNELMLRLISILEEDAINYSDSFPLTLNNIMYEDISDYINLEESPNEKLIRIILDNNLLADILMSYYSHNSSVNDFYYYPIENVINSLNFNSIETPFLYKRNENKIDIYYDDNLNIEKWKRDNNIPEEHTALESVLYLVNNNETIIKKLIDNPIARRICFDHISSRGLNENLVLKEFSTSYMDEYLDTKISLMKTYSDIHMDTSAYQDFSILFKENSLENFIKNDSSDNLKVMDIVKNIYEDHNIDFKYEIEYENNTPKFKSTENPNLDEKLIIKEIADTIISMDMLDELLNAEGIPKLAQQQLISDGVNVRISVADGYEYTALRNLKSFNELYKINENDDEQTKLAKIIDYYDLNKELSIYEINGILNIYDSLNTQGNLAYIPINFSYDLKDKTVSKVEEQLSNFDGFKVSIEPIRYYPYGKTASHVLGYMGKISQSVEIDQYINKLNYLPDTIIGKTGIEESYQKNLYGENGYKKLEVDVVGNTSNVISEIKPIPGDNIYLTLDYNLQKRAEDTLERILYTIRTGGTVESVWGDYPVTWSTSKSKPYTNATSGACMVVDVKTGEVLAMASYPSFDPNLFATGISSADWESLIPKDDLNPLASRPLYNIATQTSIQPGSTFKMITALAALENGMDPTTEIDDMGYVDIGDTQFGCWLWNQNKLTHGRESLINAIRDSCNYYFYTLALGENQKTGEKLSTKVSIEDISNMAKKFGLGSNTGMEINIPQESAQGVPDPTNKINNSKALLRRWLYDNIENYYFGEKKYDPNVEYKIVESIVSWLDKEETMTLKEVYEGLNELRIDGEKKVSGKNDTLADLIKFTYINNSKWTLADTINITIGQGSNSYTLSQMTNYVAAIANGGYKNKLTLVNNIKNHENTNIKYQNSFSSEKIDLRNSDDLEYLREGMYLASLANRNDLVFKEFPVKVGLKTGTAERSGVNPYTKEEYDSFSYEVAFAPYENPEIAVGVVIFQGGSGANCSPIVRELVAEYMGLYKEVEKDNLPFDMNLIP